jgi:hypothetical protein
MADTSPANQAAKAGIGEIVGGEACASRESIGQYPRPQLRRDHWIDLCGRWAFAYDRENVGLQERWWVDPASERSIEVPFPPESPLAESTTPASIQAGTEQQAGSNDR